MMTESRQAESSIAPGDLQRLLAEGHPARLIDVRTPGEFASGHVPGAKLMPLDDLGALQCQNLASESAPIYVLCQSGSRARRAIAKLKGAGVPDCILVDGGTQAWVDAGFPVVLGKRGGLPLMRQVQIIVGSVSAAGAVLALTLNPLFALVPLVLGSGLLFAGVTGICGLALLLAKMPWNRVRVCGDECGCNAGGAS